MLTAMMVLWNMRGAAHDVWAVNTDFDYHEEQKTAAPWPAADTPAREEVVAEATSGRADRGCPRAIETAGSVHVLKSQEPVP
jgi:hypothetical protein